MELQTFQAAFGGQVRKVREKNNLKAKQVAEKDGQFTTAYLSALENGKINATIDTVRRLSLATGAPASEFFAFQ